MQSSDGIIVFENDSLHAVCSRRLSMKTPTFAALNRVIGESLVNIVAPAAVTQAAPFYASASAAADDPSATASSFAKERRARLVPPADADLLSGCPPLHLWSDPAAHLFAHPGYKLSTVRTIPQLSRASKSFSSAGWRYLLKHLAQMGLQAAAPMEDGLDWRVASYAQAEAAALGKRRWHRHHSASARAASLYDPYTLFDAQAAAVPASASTAAAAAAVAAAVAASGHSSAAAPGSASASGSSAALFDAPMPPPSYLRAFMDGESYLECRLLEAARARNEREKDNETSGGRGDSTARGSTAGSSFRRGSSSSSSSSSAALDAADTDPSDSSSSYTCALSQLLYLRGSAVCSADASGFLDPSLYAPFALNPLLVARSPTQIHGDERLATAWTNGQSVVPPLDHMLDKIYSMLHAKVARATLLLLPLWYALQGAVQVCFGRSC